MEEMRWKRWPLVVMASSSSLTVVATARGEANLLVELSDCFKSMEVGLCSWLVKQPTHVEAAITIMVEIV
ncbi:hypothetical protein GUJ93_ZPchr0004g38711 [Zizania palustris]|uniref:Secreted protein n=1 Tax=Zizania palustris TaxID=103762 RepID=A0A8J5S0W0_ZIZPA|nr:hypothetical protein GUJ93_ZPchr0004g38711 [Zizania palustris]